MSFNFYEETCSEKIIIQIYKYLIVLAFINKLILF